MSSKWHKVIGIDLGTTYSAVAAYNNANMQVEIIGNPESDNPETTPSVISLHPISRKAFVGSIAKRNLPVCPEDTIIEIKREMGEDFTPGTLVKYAAQGTFNQGDPVKVRFGSRTPPEWMLPQELSAFTLMKMKEVAEREIGEEIRDAVVTVPAYFTEKQRKATEEAALLAGLYPRQLIPEPTAAAICYGVESGTDERRLYLVYDLGGGTFDVSIIQVEGSKLEVIATAGNPRLGGGDFDDAITKWAVGELLARGVDVGADRASQAKIKDRAEVAKIALSLSESTLLDLTFLKHPTIHNLELTRKKLIELIDPLLSASLLNVNEALELAKIKGVDRSHISAILLVGGSSKIPRVKQLLLDFFQKDESFVRGDLNPDTVVARGAAMMAQKFAPSPPPFDIRQRKQHAQLMNADAEVQEVRMITEHSLGIDTDGGRFTALVQRGTNIPIKVRRGGFTNGGPGPVIPVGVYQGEDKSVYNDSLVGTLNIGPMEPRPQGFHQFEVEFSLDINGLLTMVVYHLNENKSYQAKFDQKTGVGGDDALVAKRAILLERYTSSAAGVVVPPPSTTSAGGSQPGMPPTVHQPGTWGYPAPPSATQQPGGWSPPPPVAAPGYSPPDYLPPSNVPPLPGAVPPGNLPPGYAAAPGYAPAAPPAGYGPPPAAGYAASTAAGYAAPPAAGYAVPPAAGYASPAPAGYAPPAPSAYTPAGAPIAWPPVPAGVAPGSVPPGSVPPAVAPAGYGPPPSNPMTPPASAGYPGGAAAWPSAGAGPQQPPAPATPAGAAVVPTEPMIIEARVPVPEQFKQTVRRAHKQLLRRPNPVLLDAFNAFSNALNGGVTGSALEEIGDNLADIFDAHARE